MGKGKPKSQGSRSHAEVPRSGYSRKKIRQDKFDGRRFLSQGLSETCDGSYFSTQAILKTEFPAFHVL